MSDKKFNLKNYKKINGDEHIDMRLEEQRSEAPNVINEKQLEDYRATESNVSIEKMLEDSRTGEETEITEKRLDTHKPKFANKYRNPDAYTGDLNKLEEQRLNGDRVEDEKYSTASETPSQLRWWEEKSPDGLKLAKNTKTAARRDDRVEEMSFDNARFNEIGEEGEVPEYSGKTPTAIDSDEEDFDIDVNEEKDANEALIDIGDEESLETPEGTMRIAPELSRDIYQPNSPEHSGIFYKLIFNPKEFASNPEAIEDEVISKIIDKRPDLGTAIMELKQQKEIEGLNNPVADSRVFDFMNVDEKKGTVSVGLVGSQWVPYMDESNIAKGASPLVEENPAEDIAKMYEQSQTDDFRQIKHEIKNIDGTPMAIGAFKYKGKTFGPAVDKENIAEGAVRFLKNQYPDIVIDKNSLDFSRFEGKGIIQYMAGQEMQQGSDLSANEEFDIQEKQYLGDEDLTPNEKALSERTPEEIAEDEANDAAYRARTLEETGVPPAEYEEFNPFMKKQPERLKENKADEKSIEEEGKREEAEAEFERMFDQFRGRSASSKKKLTNKK